MNNFLLKNTFLVALLYHRFDNVVNSIVNYSISSLKFKGVYENPVLFRISMTINEFISYR